MPAATHNFFIEQGSNFVIVFEYFDANGNFQDLSNYCIRLRMKSSDGAFQQIYTSSMAETGYSLTKPLNKPGTVEWALSSTETQKYNFDTAVYDLDINDQDNQSTKLATGIIQLIRSNFPDCLPNGTGICAPCGSATPIDNITSPTITPTVTNINGQPNPTPTPTSIVNNEPEDLCDYLCRDMDMFAKLYSYNNTIIINDLSSTTGTIHVAETGVVTNVEVNIAGLNHTNPQDLAMILYNPAGSGVLLSAYNKIKNYSAGMNYTFSNRALPGVYLNNRSNFDSYVNILNKTSIYKTSESLDYSLESLIGVPPSGDWSLVVHDHDLGSSGVINGWNLILTYAPEPYIAE